MRLKTIIAAVGAVALMASPAMAASNPAASLSVAKSARATAKAGDSKFLSGGWLPVLLVGAVAVAAIIVLENNDDSPDSP